MKRKASLRRPGHPFSQIDAVLSSFMAIGKLWFAPAEEFKDEIVPEPEQAPPPSESNETANAITLVSASNHYFLVGGEVLQNLYQLAPTIAHLISDLGSEMEIPLRPVGSPALFLLIQMASGNYNLQSYLRGLSKQVIQKLRNDAQYLQSKALEELIESSILSLEDFPEEMLKHILENLNPIDRNNLRLVDEFLRKTIDRARLPQSKGGYGWTDTMPIVDSFPVITIGKGNPSGWSRSVLLGKFLYIVDRSEKHISIVDLTGRKVVVDIEVGHNINQVFRYGKFLYVSDGEALGAGAVSDELSVIDTEQNKVVHVISVGMAGSWRGFFARGDTLFVTSVDRISVIDLKRHEVVHTIQGNFAYTDILGIYDNILVAKNYNRAVSFIDLDKNEVRTHDFRHLKQALLDGKSLYVTTHDDYSVSIVDVKQGEAVLTIQDAQLRVPQSASLIQGQNENRDGLLEHEIFVCKQFLFLLNKEALFVINRECHELIHTIIIGNKERSYTCVYGKSLYMTHVDGTLSVIDLEQCKVIKGAKNELREENYIQVGQTNLYRLNFHGKYLYLRHGGKISAVDTDQHKLIRTIQIGDTLRMFFYLNSLFVGNQNGDMSVVDLGGYL